MQIYRSLKYLRSLVFPFLRLPLKRVDSTPNCLSLLYFLLFKLKCREIWLQWIVKISTKPLLNFTDRRITHQISDCTANRFVIYYQFRLSNLLLSRWSMHQMWICEVSVPVISPRPSVASRLLQFFSVLGIGVLYAFLLEAFTVFECQPEARSWLHHCLKAMVTKKL